MRVLDQGGEPLQRRALAAYLALTERREDWASVLIMLSGSDEAAPFALAALAAGAAVLWVRADEPSLRSDGLLGLVDFQVTTLTEALRILKNEIRKGLPVSVGVLDEAQHVWSEAVERGVQPYALLAGVEQANAADVLRVRGAFALGARTNVEIREHRTATWRERRTGDAALLSTVDRLNAEGCAIAERWLRAAPRLFPRDLVRCYAAAWEID